MRAEIYTELPAFYSDCEKYLEDYEAENGLLLGFMGILLKNPPKERPFMVRIMEGAEIRLVAFYGEKNLILSHGHSGALPLLLDEARAQGCVFPGVLGPAELSENFASAWSRAVGCDFNIGMDQKILKMNKLIPAREVEGNARLIEPRDVPLVTEFILGFHREAIPNDPTTPEAARENASSRVSGASTFVWETEGRIVAMAALARPTRRGITVNAVYTEPKYRGRGFASALVHRVSHEAFKRGKEFCVLYTDRNNPTSNSIYEKLGYRPIAESKVFAFSTR